MVVSVRLIVTMVVGSRCEKPRVSDQYIYAYSCRSEAAEDLIDFDVIADDAAAGCDPATVPRTHQRGTNINLECGFVSCEYFNHGFWEQGGAEKGLIDWNH